MTNTFSGPPRRSPLAREGALSLIRRPQEDAELTPLALLERVPRPAVSRAVVAADCQVSLFLGLKMTLPKDTLSMLVSI